MQQHGHFAHRIEFAKRRLAGFTIEKINKDGLPISTAHIQHERGFVRVA